MNMVLVTWRDHWGDARHGEWQKVRELASLEPLEVHSIGFLVRQDETMTVLAATLDEDNVTNVLCLLTSQVISVVELGTTSPMTATIKAPAVDFIQKERSENDSYERRPYVARPSS